MSAVLQQRPDFVEAQRPPDPVDKWEALRALGAARKSYGLTDRQLSVLQALISFHPSRTLDPHGATLVVYPSNRTICERLNGMPCSTMRRHIAHLVAAGLISRRDSPNGKRYSRRHDGEKIAFGFDLTPLVARFHEFCAAAQAARDAEARLLHHRETVRLMLRDLTALAEYGMSIATHLAAWQRLADLAAETARSLRRKLGPDELAALETRLNSALSEARQHLESANPSTSHNHSEHHNQNLEKEFESPAVPQPQRCDELTRGARRKSHGNPTSFRQVLAACPTIAEFSLDPLRHWPDLVRTADTLAPMLGIPRSAWNEARSVMGPADAATVISVLLERSDTIRAPGAYLRSLSRQARAGRFTPQTLLGDLARRSSQLRTPDLSAAGSQL